MSEKSVEGSELGDDSLDNREGKRSGEGTHLKVNQGRPLSPSVIDVAIDR